MIAFTVSPKFPKNALCAVSILGIVVVRLGRIPHVFNISTRGVIGAPESYPREEGSRRQHLVFHVGLRQMLGALMLARRPPCHLEWRFQAPELDTCTAIETISGALGKVFRLGAWVAEPGSSAEGLGLGVKGSRCTQKPNSGFLNSRCPDTFHCSWPFHGAWQH